MTAGARRARSGRAPALPRVLGPIRPRPRWQEARLLALVARRPARRAACRSGATVDGHVRLCRPARPRDLPRRPARGAPRPGPGRPPDRPGPAADGRAARRDLAPAHGAAAAGPRRPRRSFGTDARPRPGPARLAARRAGRSRRRSASSSAPTRWLRRYKYTWAAAGIGLLLLTFVFGTEVNGQRLTLQIGPLSGQPSELLKVILVVFLAGYLSENRALLVEQDTRLGPLRLPPLPYLAPMVAMWAIALGIVVVQRDLGAALLFFGVFLALLYVATGRVSLVVIGLVLFVARQRR